jgi:molybdopterin converting factor small subunit
MKITVKLFAVFRNDRFKIEDREFPNETTVGDVLTSLGIDHPELGVALVNARHVTKETVLTDGQTLSLFPKVGGG